MTTCFIQNVSRFDISSGFHADAGVNSCLIQITDHDCEFPVPKYNFSEVHQFKFDDVEDLGNPYVITNDEAERISQILKDCLRKNRNIIVHCQAGLCRSGAVVEVGIALGFIDTEKVRKPNMTIKKMLMDNLGLSFDPSKSAFLDEWETI